MTVNPDTATICYGLYNMMVFFGMGLFLGALLTLLVLFLVGGLGREKVERNDSL